VYGCEDKCMQISDGTFIRSGISSLVSRKVSSILYHNCI